MHKLRVRGGGGLQGQRDLLIVFWLLRAGVLALSREVSLRRSASGDRV